MSSTQTHSCCCLFTGTLSSASIEVSLRRLVCAVRQSADAMRHGRSISLTLSKLPQHLLLLGLDDESRNFSGLLRLRVSADHRKATKHQGLSKRTRRVVGLWLGPLHLHYHFHRRVSGPCHKSTKLEIPVDVSAKWVSARLPDALAVQSTKHVKSISACSR